MSLIRRAMESRAAPLDAAVGWNDPAAIPPNSSYMRHAAGVVINERTAMQLGAVWACVSLLADTVSGLPLKAYRRPGGGQRVEVSNPPPLVVDPFPGLEFHEGVSQGMISLLLRGNAYYHIIGRDSLGNPSELDPIHPDNVNVKFSRGIISYEINRRPVPIADVVHIRGQTLPGAAVGLSPVQYLAQSFGVGLAAEEYGARFFSQGAHVDGVLTTDQTLTEDTARALAQRWQATHGGLAQSHIPAVLEGGLKWQPISIPPEQAQFLATRGYSRSETAMIYRVPPHLIGDVDRTTSWGRGLEEQWLNFLSIGLRPHLIRFESAWSRLQPRGQFSRFDVKELLRTNILARYQTYAIGRTIGMLNNDEIRAEEDMEPQADGMGKAYDAPLNSNTSGVVSTSLRPGVSAQDDIAT